MAMDVLSDHQDLSRHVFVCRKWQTHKQRRVSKVFERNRTEKKSSAKQICELSSCVVLAIDALKISG